MFVFYYLDIHGLVPLYGEAGFSCPCCAMPCHAMPLSIQPSAISNPKNKTTTPFHSLTHHPLAAGQRCVHKQ